MQKILKKYFKFSTIVGLFAVFSILFVVKVGEVFEIPSIKIPDLDNLFKGKPPITTSLADAVTEVPFLDDFNPKVFTRLTILPRGPNGDFLMRPGLFELNAQSY